MAQNSFSQAMDPDMRIKVLVCDNTPNRIEEKVTVVWTLEAIWTTTDNGRGNDAKHGEGRIRAVEMKQRNAETDNH